MSFVKKNSLGILLCLAIGIPSYYLGTLFPIIGGPVFAILIGMAVAFIPKDNYKKDLSKYIGIFLRKHETNGYRFEYSSENGDKSIDLKSIIYFSANNHDIFFVKNNRDIVNISSRRENLTSLRDKLADKGFISVSRTYLVNYRYLLSLSRD